MNAVDTNVIIYACDCSDSARQSRAIRMIDGLEDAVIIWQVAAEFIAASRKLADQGFTRDDAWARLESLLQAWPLVLPTANVLTVARAMLAQQQLAFWDALLIAACIDAGVTTLYSEDVPGQAIPGIQIVDPFTSGH